MLGEQERPQDGAGGKCNVTSPRWAMPRPPVLSGQDPVLCQLTRTALRQGGGGPGEPARALASALPVYLLAQCFSFQSLVSISHAHGFCFLRSAKPVTDLDSIRYLNFTTRWLCTRNQAQSTQPGMPFSEDL